MIIIPAIDIIEGKCVRLSKGDFNKQTIYSEDPVTMARSFEEAGLNRLHIVDLDGAKKGKIQNLKVLESIASKTKLTIDFGGGIKNNKDMEQVFNAGAHIITLGSLAVKKPGLIEELVLEYGPEKILIGADVLNNKIKISGWLEDGGIDVFDFIHNMMASGITQIFCTDISKDGMMEGIAEELYKKILQTFPVLQLTASGGVTNIGDLHKLEEIGCKGVIVGKAIYEGIISLKELNNLNTKI